MIFLKIEKIKINSFGKLENKEYNLEFPWENFYYNKDFLGTNYDIK